MKTALTFPVMVYLLEFSIQVKQTSLLCHLLERIMLSVLLLVLHLEEVHDCSQN